MMGKGPRSLINMIAFYPNGTKEEEIRILGSSVQACMEVDGGPIFIFS